MGYDGVKFQGEPDKTEKCNACKTTKALRNILRAAYGCDDATFLGTDWVIRECERGLSITVYTPKKFS